MKSKQDYLDLLIKQVKFPFDHKAIRKEYAAHIEDCVDNLMEDGLVYLDAEEQAVEAMGDPIEAGIILNRVHNPILGWIHFLSKYALIALVILLTYSYGSDLIQSFTSNADTARGHLRERIEDLDYIEHHAIVGEASALNASYTFTDVILTSDNQLVIFYQTKRINFWRNDYYTLSTVLKDISGVTIDNETVELSVQADLSGIPDEGLGVLNEGFGFLILDHYKNDHILIIQSVTEIPETLILELEQSSKSEKAFEIDLKEVRP